MIEWLIKKEFSDINDNKSFRVSMLILLSFRILEMSDKSLSLGIVKLFLTEGYKK